MTKQKGRLAAPRPGSSFFWGVSARDDIETVLCRIERVAENFEEVAREEIAEGVDASSPAYRKFTEYAGRLRHAVAQDDIKLAIITALRLGALGHEFMYTALMARDFVTGYKRNRGGDKGRQNRITRHDEIRRVYNEVRNAKPHLTKSATYKAVARQYDVSAHTVRRAVRGVG
jgi:hypothetical protein